jgi:hypothetical protein
MVETRVRSTPNLSSVLNVGARDRTHGIKVSQADVISL